MRGTQTQQVVGTPRVFKSEVTFSIEVTDSEAVLQLTNRTRILECTTLKLGPLGIKTQTKKETIKPPAIHSGIARLES